MPTRQLSPTERENVNKNRVQWAEKLAAVLREWCTINQYMPRKLLAQELGILDNNWKHIVVGDGLTDDISIYARLHVRTELAEADPRTVPPKALYAPRGLYYYERAYAWTEHEYTLWLNRHGYSLPREVQTSVPVTDELPDIRTLFEQLLLDPLAQRIVRALEPRLLKAMGSAIGDKHPTAQSDDVGVLADKLYNALVAYVEGTPEERDQLMAKYGKTHLARVYSLLRDLSLPPDDREQALKVNQTISERSR